MSHGTQPVLGGYVHNIPETSQAHNRRRHEKTSATNFSAYSHSGKFCPLKVQRAHHPCTGTSSPMIQMIGIESQPPYSSEARYYSCESLEYANGLLWKREWLIVWQRHRNLFLWCLIPVLWLLWPTIWLPSKNTEICQVTLVRRTQRLKFTTWSRREADYECVCVSYWSRYWAVYYQREQQKNIYQRKRMPHVFTLFTTWETVSFWHSKFKDIQIELIAIHKIISLTIKTWPVKRANFGLKKFKQKSS